MAFFFFQNEYCASSISNAEIEMNLSSQHKYFVKNDLKLTHTPTSIT